MELPIYIHIEVLINLLAIGFIAFLMSFYITPLLIQVAYKLNIVDKPDGKLKQHETATPYLGGLAVYIGFIIALALVFPFQNNMFLFLVGTTLLLFLGLIDDLVVLSPQQKFFGQIIATFCFLKAGFFLRESFFSSVYNIIISFFWILTITNAFNLLDVMDGLAATVAIMATISFLACSLVLAEYTVSLLLAAFLGALLAFLYFNKPKASIYLGDSGSLFIGGLLATIPFMLPWGTYNILGAFTPVIILAIPLLEIATLIIIRTYKGIPFYKGSPDHYCLYLKRNNWSIKQILSYTIIMSSTLLIASFGFITNTLSLDTVLALGFLFILVWFCVFIPFSYYCALKMPKF